MFLLGVQLVLYVLIGRVKGFCTFARPSEIRMGFEWVEIVLIGFEFVLGRF
jgi:hypothetical protein